MTAWGTFPSVNPFDPMLEVGPDKFEVVELVGPHLRVSGTLSLLRFKRLSDLLNLSHGFLRLTDAGLLRRNGDPTGLLVEELMVNQDDITFVAQRVENVSTDASGLAGGMDRPLMERIPRKVAIFTEGHTITGSIYMFGETDIATFVDSPDPRYVPMIDVVARSLADRRVISHFGLVLVNRSRITAASLLEKSGGAEETGFEME